jgi:hypothetical protein
MITSANFVTYPGEKRLQALEFAVASIRQQVDIVRICWNNYDSVPPGFDFALNKIPIEDLTDNGKFYFTPFANEDIYLTCDDDILYPEDYVATMLRSLEYNPIVTFHGRQLVPHGRHSYYRGGHLCYSYLNYTPLDKKVHVGGTGVMGIDLNKYRPNISHSPFKCMSDLVLSLDAAQNNIPIICAAHPDKWLHSIRTGQETIANKFRKEESQQIAIMNEIFNIFDL